MRLKLHSITLITFLFACLMCSAAEKVQNVVVYHNEKEFAGWPANEGIWSWGNEILVGYNVGAYKHAEKGHSVEGPLVYGFSRSMDGGETWTSEPHPEIKHYRDINPKLISEYAGPIDFGASGFAMKIRQHSYFLSDDKGHTWNGPWLLPQHPDPYLLARTCYIVTGKDSALLFLGSVQRPNTTNTERGRSSVMQTQDGGKTWQFLSFIGKDPGEGIPESELPAFSIMPSAVQIGPDHFVAAVRCRKNRNKWAEIYESTDHCRTWKYLGELEAGSNNPISLVSLGGKKIAAIYGWRGNDGMGIRAKVSPDGGHRWSQDKILRNDALTWDIGYTRAIVRPDGKVLVVYYYTTKENPQPHIEATIWEPAVERDLTLQSLQQQGLQLISSFYFEAPGGAKLKSVQDQVGRAAWSDNLAGAEIVQGKGLRIRCNSEKGNAVSYLPLGDFSKAKAVWMFLEVGGWKFEGDKMKSFFLGLGQRSDKMSAVVQLRIRGNQKVCDLTYEALHSREGTTSGRPQKIGGNTNEEAFALALEYVESERRYALYRVREGGLLEKIGEGKSSPVRNARFVHLAVQGDFSTTPDEHLDIRTLGIAVIPK